MQKNVNGMYCGHCGCETFSVYTVDVGNGLFLECNDCKSVTGVCASSPRLEISWGEDAKGILCIMPKISEPENRFAGPGKCARCGKPVPQDDAHEYSSARHPEKLKPVCGACLTPLYREFG